MAKLQKKSKSTNPTTSIRLSDDDKAMIAQAMEIEGIDALATWIIRTVRLRARDLIDGTKDKKILDAIKSVELRVEIAEANISSELRDIETKLDSE